MRFPSYISPCRLCARFSNCQVATQSVLYESATNHDPRQEESADWRKTVSTTTSATRGVARTRWLSAIGVATLRIASPAAVQADPVVLQDYLFNVNGTSSCPDAACGGSLLPPGLDSSAFDFSTGIGTLVWTFNAGAAGSYFFDAFFDHDLHAPFFNEFGTVNGAAGAGVSWQIDEPGFGDGNRLGTIFDNAMANALDNTNHVPGTTSNFLNTCGGNGGGAADPTCNNDVSLAMGFNFVLAANQQVVLTLATSTVRPGGGFFLQQRDPDSPGDDLFLTGALEITSAPATVPEPATLLLVGGGLIAGANRARRRMRQVV